METFIGIIASFILGGVTIGGWIRYEMLKEMEEMKRKEMNAKLWQQLLEKGVSDE